MSIRSLRLIALFGALLFVGISVTVTLWGLNAQRDDALLINLAGRQRMLIQEMALEALTIQVADDQASRRMLHETADLFEQTLDALEFGGATRTTDGRLVTLLPPDEHDEEIIAQLGSARLVWNELHPNIHALLESPSQSPAFAEAMRALETLSPVLLAQMDEAVLLYEINSEGKVAFVRAIQISFLATAAILLLLAFATIEYRVIHPIARLDDAARRIGRGNLETPISVTGLGELDRLANSLDEMRARLKVSVESQIRRAQEAETLRQAGAVVAASLRQDEAIERILEQLARVVPFDSASVMLLGEGYLEIVGGRGWTDPAEVVGLRFPMPGDNPNTLVIQQSRPHILGDAPSEYAAFRDGPHRHIRSWLGVPLIVGTRTIGMLAVDNAQPHFFTPDHARLAAAFADQVSITIENARLFTEIEQKASELSRLYAAAQDMTSSLDPRVVLEQLAFHLTQALGATSGYINAVDAELGAITVLAEYWSELASPAERVSDLGRNYSLHDYPLTVRAITNGEVIACGIESDLLSASELEELLERGIQAEMLIPIIARGQGIGVAQIWDSRRRRDFTEAEKLLAQTLAQHGAGIIQNAHLYAEAGKHAEQLRALRAAGHALTSDLRIEAVLQTLTETARQLVGASYAALAVLDEHGSLSQFHTAGLTEEQRQKISEPPKGLGLLGALIREGAPVRITDIARDPRSIGFPPNHPPMKTFMGVPIVAHGKVMGSLYLTEKTNRQMFTQDDEDLVVGLAADAAIAIENARLFGKVEQLAITDSLTGLHNRRHFLELAEHEFQRARRYKRPLSIIMLDIDRFKKVNDTHGHAIGDQVLRVVATRCRETLRTIDVMGRFGGEEFILLLPENELDGARRAAERLRLRIAEAPIQTERGPVSVTISLGVAAIRADCPDLKTMLDRVDAAMYAAKEAGRNRVEAWTG